MPEADVRDLHEIRVRAPAELVLKVAETFDVQSLRPVRALFWLRARLLGATVGPARWPRGLVAETLALGWSELALEPGKQRVMGAVTRPWEANVCFTAVAPEHFLAFSEADRVKIVWTLESESESPGVTLFRTETRALATDEGARRKFRRYWRTFGPGIVLIRLLLLPALRHEAERRQRDVSRRSSQPSR